MKFDFHDKVVLVTGASRGIGKAVALMFAKSGANVIVHYHKNEQGADDTLALLGEGDHMKIQADVSDPNQVEDLVTKGKNRFGRIDILVNNAGVAEEFEIMDLSYSQWQATWKYILDTNLTGAANCAFLVAKTMKDKGGCKIVNVSSRGAFRGEPFSPAYGASKAGMNAFGQSMAKALARYNTFVYTVAPGFIETDMAAEIMVGERGEEIRNQSPLKRIGTPEEVA
ncbi:MAG: SDR family oxidoreductase [Bacteroidales bacterium]